MDILFPDEEAEMETSEIKLYMSEPAISKSSNILKWWKSSEARFPSLSKLAKKYLCIPATSTPSERVFSSAGNVVSAKRNCLLTEHVDKLVFLHQNSK